jgi:hypothetical protein
MACFDIFRMFRLLFGVLITLCCSSGESSDWSIYYSTTTTHGQCDSFPSAGAGDLTASGCASRRRTEPVIA